MLTARRRIRVEWGHCDPARIIYNPNYYIWMDQGTHHLFEAAGYPFAETVRTTPFRGCPLVASGIEFRHPANYNDVIELSSTVTRFGTKSFTVGHVFRRDGVKLAEGHEIRVWGWSEPEAPERLIAVPVPDEVRTLLSRDGCLDVNP